MYAHADLADDKERLLDRVTRFYVESKDFNGIPAWLAAKDLGLKAAVLRLHASQLVQEGHITPVFRDRHPNPHIRALPDEPAAALFRKIKRASLRDFCLYPSPATLVRIVDPKRYDGRPFTLKLALGEPQLVFYAFDLAVLEFYRNDPRYRYDHNDISGRIGVTDQYFRGRGMEPRDKVLLEAFGFAYNDSLDRAVAVFLRYLADLTPEHQQVWNAKLVGNSPQWKLHPDYYRASILGDRPERISIFEAFTWELRTINEMCERMAWPLLFRETFTDEKRPRDFGFLLRPTLKEFQGFVQLLDRMISDNINRGFFSGRLLLEHEQERRDGKVAVRPKGSIELLEEWLAGSFRSTDQQTLKEMLGIFREVRHLRQRPAHSVDEDRFDQVFFHQQRDLMIRAYGAVCTLRLILANHQAVRGYEVNDVLREAKVWTY